MDEFIAEIECLTCHKTVKALAKPSPHGSGVWYVILCPECDKLAYNSATPPICAEHRIKLRTGKEVGF